MLGRSCHKGQPVCQLTGDASCWGVVVTKGGQYVS